MPKETKRAVRSFIVSLCLREAAGSGARGAFAGRAKGTWKLLGALEKQNDHPRQSPESPHSLGTPEPNHPRAYPGRDQLLEKKAGTLLSEGLHDDAQEWRLHVALWQRLPTCHDLSVIPSLKCSDQGPTNKTQRISVTLTVGNHLFASWLSYRAALVTPKPGERIHWERFTFWRHGTKWIQKGKPKRSKTCFALDN